MCSRRTLEAWKLQIAHARHRALELSSARDIDEHKQAENHLAQDRITRHLQRVEKLRQRELDLPLAHGLEEGGMDSSTIRGAAVDDMQATCDAMLERLLSLRASFHKAMRLEILRREELETFAKQRRELDMELQASEKSLRRSTRGGAIRVLRDGDPTKGNGEVDTTVIQKRAELNLYESILKQRRGVWYTALRHVQELKVALRGTEERIRITLHEMEKNVTTLRRRVSRLGVVIARKAALHRSMGVKAETIRTRSILVKDEISRIGSRDQPQCETNVWQPGVNQRISTEKLKTLLKVPN